jgi:hypothetical protein
VSEHNPATTPEHSAEASSAAAAEATRRDEKVVASPGRMPSVEEEAAAEAAAAHVDLDKVGEHEREMLEKGANVQGEGQVP